MDEIQKDNQKDTEKGNTKIKKLEKEIDSLVIQLEEKDKRIKELEHVVDVYVRFIGGETNG